MHAAIPIRICGVDFTSAPLRSKRIVIAAGHLTPAGFALESLESLSDWPAFRFKQRLTNRNGLNRLLTAWTNLSCGCHVKRNAIAQRRRAVASSSGALGWAVDVSWNSMYHQPRLRNDGFHPISGPARATNSRVLLRGTTLVGKNDGKYGRAASQTTERNVISVWIGEHRKAGYVDCGESRNCGHSKVSSDAQRRSDRRCAALSRIVQRPYGARSTAMLERAVKARIIFWFTNSKYDLHDPLCALKLRRRQLEGHFNTIVIASGDFKHAAS